MEKSGAARVKQVYYWCAVFSVTHFKQRVFLLYLLAVYFALPVKYTVYCSTAISVVVVVPQPEAQPLEKELVVVVVPQPEAQPLKVHPKTCQVYPKISYLFVSFYYNNKNPSVLCVLMQIVAIVI